MYQPTAAVPQCQLITHFPSPPQPAPAGLMETEMCAGLVPQKVSEYTCSLKIKV